MATLAMTTATKHVMVTATRWWATKRAMARAARAMTMATKRAMATVARGMVTASKRAKGNGNKEGKGNGQRGQWRWQQEQWRRQQRG